MKSRPSLVIAGIGMLLASGAMAQATGTPSYSAPDRAFRRSEFGAIMSFPEPGGTAVEGLYRTGTGRTDWSVRLGMLQPGGLEPTSVLAVLESPLRGFY